MHLKPSQATTATNLQRENMHAATGTFRCPGPWQWDWWQADQGIIVRVGRLPVDSVLRAQATGERQGFMKVLLAGNDDRIVGFTMIGAAAGEVMAVVQTAILPGAPYGRLADAIFAHPTMAEGVGMLFWNVPRRSLQHVTPERAA
jgi:hypothetical protein